MAYGEDRENGTPLQTNDTRTGLGALGFDWGAPERGRGVVRLWGETQVFHQAFTAVSADRSREDLTRTQRVPADAFGLSAQWGRVLGSRHRLLAGAEAREVRGTTEETVYARGTPTTAVEAGGTERSGAVFLQDLFQAHPRLLLAGALRVDAWAHRDGRSVTTPLATSVSTTTAFPDRSETALSPRLGLSFRASPALSLLASGYGAFRGPTLNELYRSFRVGDTLTLANPALEAERLWGGEAGALATRGPVSLRLTAFDAEVEGAVANVTVTTAPGLVTRQRRNVAGVRSRGLEAEAEWLVAARGVLTAGYALTDARVRSFPEDPTLEGRRVPQVPRHQVTLQARYAAPRWRLGLQARWTSAAWEDDRNQLELDPALQIDLFAGRGDRERPRGLRRGGEPPRRPDRRGPHPGAEPGRAAPPARGRPAAGLLSSARAGAVLEVGGRVQVAEEPGRVPVAGQLLGWDLSHPDLGPEGGHLRSPAAIRRRIGSRQAGP